MSSPDPSSSPPLRCPQCGGENVLPSGERLLPCAFCGASLYVDRSGLVSHYRLPRLVDRAAAEQAVRRWMAGNDTVKDLDRKATDLALVPLSFPLWMFRCRQGGGETVLARPAAATPEPALADLAVPAGKLEPYRLGGEDGAREGAAEGAAGEAAAAELVPAGEPRVIPASVPRIIPANVPQVIPASVPQVIPASVPLDTARQWLPAGGEVTETALVHVPLWRATYRFAGRAYSAVVEASTGAVFASVFPEKAEAPYLAVAALGLLVFGAEGLLIVHPLWKALAMGVTALPLFAAAWWVTSRV